MFAIHCSISISSAHFTAHRHQEVKLSRRVWLHSLHDESDCQSVTARCLFFKYQFGKSRLQPCMLYTVYTNCSSHIQLYLYTAVDTPVQFKSEMDGFTDASAVKFSFTRHRLASDYMPWTRDESLGRITMCNVRCGKPEAHYTRKWERLRRQRAIGHAWIKITQLQEAQLSHQRRRRTRWLPFIVRLILSLFCSNYLPDDWRPFDFLLVYIAYITIRGSGKFVERARNTVIAD